MFHEGDLQSGIALAISQQKLVACFVTDEEEESSGWETLLRMDSDLRPAIQSKAVLLRLPFGSQEAGFLSAFCPIESAPRLVVINNGRLAENIGPGTVLEEVSSRLLQVVSLPAPEGSKDSTDAVAITNAASSDNAATVENTAANTESTPTKEDKGKRKASPGAKQEEPGPPISYDKDTSNTTEALPKTQRDTWVQQQRQRNEEALAERRRILKQIESDRKEQKQREQNRRLAVAEEKKQRTEYENKQTKAAAAVRGQGECALKIRTFDGSTISSKFPSDQTLREHVRPWVDLELGKPKVPYDFKHVLAPMPNRRISVSEEEESLRSLGLAPSATLVMVPIEAFTEAYSTSDQGYISRGISYSYGVVQGGVSMVGSLIGTVIGTGRGDDSTPSNMQNVDGTAEGPRSPIKVRTLRNQAGASDDQQLYNGNQLNFEPRREDKEDEDD